MLEISGLNLAPDASHSHHTPLAVDHCQFAGGTLNVVLGRNFSGKTALCRLLTGLPGRAQGQVLLDGQDISSRKPAERPIALVNQAFVNYPHWTVRMNLASPLRAQRCQAEEIEHRVGTIAQQLQLTELLERLPEQLSGGQQQRLAIGRALAKGARVLVMDEPLVNLDYKLREALELELAALLKDQGVTLIYTSTDPRDALLLADQVLLMADYKLLQCGTPEAIYTRPNSELAAQLMSDPSTNRVNENGLLVRPEHLYLAPPEDDYEAFAVTVSAVETNGSQTYLHGLFQKRDWIAKLDGMHRFDSGTQLTLYARRSDLLLLTSADED